MKSYPSFFLLAALVSFPQLSETIYTPSLPELTKYFSTSANMMQHSLSVYFLGFALGVFCFGRLCDLIGRKRSMLCGLCIYVVGSLFCALSSNIILFLLARILQAFGAAVGSVVTQTMLRDLYTGEERGRIFSKLTAVIAFAPAMGPFIGSQLSYAFSPHVNFWFLFVLGMMLLFTSSAKLSETMPTMAKTDILPLLKRMIRDPFILFISFFIAAHNGILFGLHAEAPFILIDILHMSPSNYGLIGLILGSSVFIGSNINTRLLRRYSPFALNAVGTTLMFFSFALLVAILPLFSALNPSVALTVFLVLVGVSIVGMGISLPNCLSVALKDYRHAAGSAGAILGLIYYVMIGGLMAIMSTIHNGTIWPMPIYFLILSALLVAGSLVLSRREAQPVKAR